MHLPTYILHIHTHITDYSWHRYCAAAAMETFKASSVATDDGLMKMEGGRGACTRGPAHFSSSRCTCTSRWGKGEGPVEMGKRLKVRAYSDDGRTRNRFCREQKAISVSARTPHV